MSKDKLANAPSTLCALLYRKLSTLTFLVCRSHTAMRKLIPICGSTMQMILPSYSRVAWIIPCSFEKSISDNLAV